MASDRYFGDILRDARKAQGYSVSAIAKELRIRNDVIQAIEDSDIQSMPPRAYSIKMITAYARFLNLNPDDIVYLYTNKSYSSRISQVKEQRNASTRQRNNASNFNNSISGRKTYSLHDDDYPTHDTLIQRPRTAQSGKRVYSPNKIHSSRGSILPETHKSNAVSTRFRQTRSFGGTKLPLVIIVALVLIVALIGFVLKFFVFTDNSSIQLDTKQTSSITGVSDPAKSGLDTGDVQNTSTQIAPTSAMFSYEVLDGDECYVEIKQDDTMVLADTLVGPQYGTYSVTGVLVFTTTNPDYITIRVDGSVVEPEVSESNNNIYQYTVDFSKILEAWKAANPVKTESQDSTTSGSNNSTSTSSGTSTKNNIKITTE